MGQKDERVNGTEMATSEEFDAETLLDSPALLVDRAARLMTGEAEPAKNLLRRLQGAWGEYLVAVVLTVLSLAEPETLTSISSSLSPLW